MFQPSRSPVPNFRILPGPALCPGQSRRENREWDNKAKEDQKCFRRHVESPWMAE